MGYPPMLFIHLLSFILFQYVEHQPRAQAKAPDEERAAFIASGVVACIKALVKLPSLRFAQCFVQRIT